uniref:Hypothetical secreted peptide n=1 Tax=Glossina morsitans morsitans TaxID=37546 RepID=D3TSN1_GLOMM
MKFIPIIVLLLSVVIVLMATQVTADQVDDILKAINNAKPGDGVTVIHSALKTP